ncbi:hypothetical protein LCGC14_0578180 [marine sediment metagenome]|uniref:Uncharacterized protein n=1 Tax=marine sediment metagenome TaxID=412755 RepID=A0A0F9S0S7_9ZZZZ
MYALVSSNPRNKQGVYLDSPEIRIVNRKVEIKLGNPKNKELITLYLTPGENVDMILALRQAEDKLTELAFTGQHLDI